MLEILKLDPENHVIQNNLGYIYLAMGELKKALKHLNKSVEINPNFSHSWHSFGEYYEKVGDKKKAHECYQKAVDIDPENQEHQEALKNIEKEEVN
jgi:Tfp pilus assembly protein PilF